MNLREHPHYSNLLDKVRQVFGDELHQLSETQEAKAESKAKSEAKKAAKLLNQSTNE